MNCLSPFLEPIPERLLVTAVTRQASHAYQAPTRKQYRDRLLPSFPIFALVAVGDK